MFKAQKQRRESLLWTWFFRLINIYSCGVSVAAEKIRNKRVSQHMMGDNLRERGKKLANCLDSSTLKPFITSQCKLDMLFLSAGSNCSATPFISSQKSVFIKIKSRMTFSLSLCCSHSSPPVHAFPSGVSHACYVRQPWDERRMSRFLSAAMNPLDWTVIWRRKTSMAFDMGNTCFN